MHSFFKRCSSSLDLMQSIINHESSGALKIAWTVFVKELLDDVNNFETEMKFLIKTINIKSKQLDENAITFDEIQLEMKQEKQNLIHEEKERYDEVIKNLRFKLESSEKDLNDTMELKNELVDKLNSLFRKRKNLKTKKITLLKENEDLHNEVEAQQEMITSLKKALDNSKNDNITACRKSYLSGIEKGRNFAIIEVNGVLQELEMLKNIQITLEDDIKHQEFNIRTQ